jgi:3-oxoadipate enol-lactonase
MDPEGYARTCESLETVDLTALVPQITAPTLVVCGEDDAPPFVSAAPWFAETIPGARLVWLSPARHAGVLEQSDQFVSALREFLATAVRT